MGDKIDLFDGIDFDEISPKKTYNKPPVNDEYDETESEPFEEYEDLDSKKKKEEIRKLQIGNEKELRNLVEKKLIISVIGEIGQSIQNNFVDIPKRQSNILANKLGIPSKENDLQLLLSDIIENGIYGVITDIERLSDEGTWN